MSSSPVPSTVPTFQRRSERVDPLDIRRAMASRLRPSTVPEDVWTVVEEIRDKGGLFDVSVQVARLELAFREIDRLVESSDMLPDTAFRERVKLATKIAELQSRALDMQLKSKDFITNDGLRLIMVSLIEVLKRHISDPAVLTKIGQELATTLKAVKGQVKS